MSGARHKNGHASPARSRVSNGSALFVYPGDGRTAEARRFRDVLAEVLSDLGGGAGLSEAKRQMARRLALLAVEAERQEHGFVCEGRLDLQAYVKASSELRLLAMALGCTEREARPVNGKAPPLEAEADAWLAT